MFKLLLATLVSIGYMAAAGAGPNNDACPTNPDPSQPSKCMPVPPAPSPAPQPAPSPSPAPMPSPAPSPSPAPAPQVSVTERVLAKLHSTNQYEINAAQMAATQAESADVKMFAMMLVDDHTASEQHLTTIAQDANVPLHDFMPQNPNETRQAAADTAELQKLSHSNGADFDREFISSQIAAHRLAYNWVRMNLVGVTDVNAKAFIKLQAMAIKCHYDMARSIRLKK